MIRTATLAQIATGLIVDAGDYGSFFIAWPHATRGGPIQDMPVDEFLAWAGLMDIGGDLFLLATLFAAINLDKGYAYRVNGFDASGVDCAFIESDGAGVTFAGTDSTRASFNIPEKGQPFLRLTPA